MEKKTKNFPFYDFNQYRLFIKKFNPIIIASLVYQPPQ